MKGDEDGGETVALVLDGACGHDGGHGAGVGGEERDEGFAVEADSAHDAIGDERGARQVAGVFEDADEEEQQENLGEEDEHGGDAFPHAVEEKRLQPAGGEERADEIGGAGQQVAEAVGERLADGEDDFKDGDDDNQKEQRSPNAMEENVVDLVGVLSGERRLIAGAAADLRGPGMRAGGVAEDGQSDGLGAGAAMAILLVEEERDGVEAGALDGADLRDGRAELARQFEWVDAATARVHEVGHVEEHERGKADGEDRHGEHELAGEVERIQNQKNSVGLGRAGHAAAENFDGDAGVLGIGRERVDAGQVDEREVFAAHAGHGPHALLDGDARVVGDLLAEASELVKERGLAGVGRADEDDGLEGLVGRHCRRLIGWSLAAGVHCAAPTREDSSEDSWAGVVSAWFGMAVVPAAPALGPVQGRTRMASAVSWRRAISRPSTE